MKFGAAMAAFGGPAWFGIYGDHGRNQDPTPSEVFAAQINRLIKANPRHWRPS